jgi:hypothetical protein
MALLFRHSYERRAEKAAEGGAKVVVVGPPCAGKTTLIKQFLEPLGVETAEEVVGLAPEAEEARGEGLRERAVRFLRGLAGGGHVSRDRVEKELAGIRGAELLKAFDELPRSFVEYLKKRYDGWSLYLFYIPPEVEEEREAVEELLKIAKRVGVEFRWLGLRYVPPGVVAMLKEGGVGYVEEQLRLYRRVLEEFDAAGGRLAKLSKLGRSIAEKTGESLLERFAEAAEEFAKVLLPLLPGGVATGAVLGVASYLLAGGGEWSRWIRLLADWSRLDGRLKDLAAAHIALSLGLGRDRVREVLDGLAAAGKRLKALESDFRRLLDEVKRVALKAAALERGLAVYFLHDVENRGLYVNFYVEDRPYLESREPSGLVAVPLVESGRFGELAAETLRRLEEEGALVLVGPKGVGKSTLAAYVVWRALREGRAYGVVKVAGGVGTEAVLRALAEEAGAELIALYDPSPTEVYYDPDYVKLTKVQQVGETLKELGALAAAEKRVKILAVLPSDLYDAVLKKAEEPALKLLEKRLEVDLRDVEFLADVIYKYSKCEETQAGEAERLAEKIAEFNGGYTLVAKYAGLWLRERGCDAGDVEKAVEEAKSQPKLFFAHYIWQVLLRGSGDLAKRVAVPLHLHAVLGPVPVGVTYITKAVNDRGIWRFLKPEELEGASLESLREDELEPIANWLAQRHEDLVEEVLKDLAGLNGEKARELYKEALGDLIKALDWARGEVLKEDVARKTAEELMKRWRRRGLYDHEAFYALGLAALAAGAEVDGETADRLLHAASFAVQEVAHPAVVLPVLAALRPLGEKAPHRYVSLLAAASELRTLDPETVRYIYDALQKLKNRLTETGHLWPLVEAIRAYSNLMRRRQWHIGGLWKEAVADMCELYSKVKGRDDTTASGNGLSAQRPSYTIAKVYVLAVALGSDVLAPLVQRYCGLSDLEKEAKDVMIELNKAADHPEELKKIMENDKDFAEWVRVRDVTEDAERAIEDLRVRLTYVLARYKLNHALDEMKLEEAAEEFKKAAEMRKRLKQWGGYLIARSLALRARVFAAKSWRELLERAGGFWELWEEAKKHLKPTARYLATAALPLGEYLVYLAASGDKRGAEELLRKWRWLLDYDPRASVNTRLMLRLLGVGDGARLKEVVDVFESSIWREYQPALLMLAGRLQKNEASNRCEQLPKPEVCVNAVAAATGDQDAVEKLRLKMRLKIKRKVPEASLLLDRVDGRTLVEVLAPKYPSAQLAFTLLAAVEGRADAVRLHGLWGSATSREPLPQQLSLAVYENCGDLNSEGCRLALLKLYYYHI